MTDDRDAITRRNALKSGTALVGVVGATGLLPERVRAETTVSGGGDELQNAIDAASGGDTLVVTDSLTYNPITVDVSVTIETTANPKIRGTGGTSAAVSIATDGVTIDGFDVRNPDGLLGIKVQQGYDNATITNNEVKNVGPTGRLGVTGIIVGQGDHDGIEIENNEIRNLDQETTDDSGFPTVNGILFDANNASPGTVSDTVVNSNTIQDVESDIAPLGIVVQHGTDGVDINNNEGSCDAGYG